MLNTLKNLLGFTMGASDGEIGKVKDFYIDDKTWKIRYLVVETGTWLFGRKVLLAPVALGSAEWEKKVFPINLTKDQIKHSPDIDTERPVSRQQEEDLHSHYSWPIDPGAGIGFMTTGMVGGVIPPDVPFEERISEELHYHKDDTMSDRGPEPEHPSEATQNANLISFKDVMDYKIIAAGQEAGTADDFLADSSWNLPFLIAKTGSWYTGQNIAIPTNWITRIEWKEPAIYTDHGTDSLRNLTEFDADQLADENFERKLYTPAQDLY